MTKDRMACPRCGRDVAAHVITHGPDGKRLRNPIRLPQSHHVELPDGKLGERCTRELHRGRPR